jgi:hypothetical protein
MTDSIRSSKVAELDTLISALQADLDACPNRLWTSEGNQARLALLIDYTAKREALLADPSVSTLEGALIKLRSSFNAGRITGEQYARGALYLEGRIDVIRAELDSASVVPNGWTLID